MDRQGIKANFELITFIRLPHGLRKGPKVINSTKTIWKIYQITFGAETLEISLIQSHLNKYIFELKIAMGASL